MIAFFNLPCESMAKTPAERVKTLLARLDSVRSSQERGSEVSTQLKALFHKFVEQAEQIFKNLPKPLEWRSLRFNLASVLSKSHKVMVQNDILHNYHIHFAPFIYS